MYKIVSKTDLIPGVIEDVDIVSIKPPKFALRINLTNIEELAQSIKEKGLLQPIVVRADNAGSFEVVAGNRRFYACKLLRWRKIPCHIVELDDKESFEVSLIENVQRKTLHPLEEAQAFKKYVSDFGWGGVSDLARKIGKSHAYVVKRIKLLDLPKGIREAIENSAISKSVAEELSAINDKEEQSKLGQLIASRNLSFRNARDLIKRRDAGSYEFNASKDVSKNPSRAFDVAIVTLKTSMSKLARVIDSEDDWIVYEILMQHKNMLHSQIDLLIKQKKKFPTHYS